MYITVILDVSDCRKMPRKREVKLIPEMNCMAVARMKELVRKSQILNQAAKQRQQKKRKLLELLRVRLTKNCCKLSGFLTVTGQDMLGLKI